MSKISTQQRYSLRCLYGFARRPGEHYWFANAGTDFAPVVETLAKALETKVPKAGDLSA